MTIVSIEFERFALEKEQIARRAHVNALVTEEDCSSNRPLIAIGNDWTRRHYDGSFYLFPLASAMPAVSLVFVQSRDGNTIAGHPAELGGGDTDLHLIYEGLSRVAADGVLAGATTARGRMFFSVWHPEIVAFRQELGMSRHPAQLVLTQDGNIDFETGLVFNVPEVPVFILAGRAAAERCRPMLERRPWITLIPIQHGNLLTAFHELHQRGIRRISAVGGPSAASALLDAGLVQDLCLTTTTVSAGCTSVRARCTWKRSRASDRRRRMTRRPFGSSTWRCRCRDGTSGGPHFGPPTLPGLKTRPPSEL